MATIGSAGTLLSQCDEVHLNCSSSIIVFLTFLANKLHGAPSTGVKGRAALSSEQWTVFFKLVWTAWGNQLS
ncbi:hypothetical protein DKX38_000151 [Salix brachista]|uniref:Uncharacterized protein n=1 Tax=Salix brachista TaxID=2182728 RepID=A0A5N5P187_9ROSI|nr:hypothetical protein DKX38_000151 [Salix brachista]